MAATLVEDRPADGVVRITLGQPGRFNALDRLAWADLDARLARLERGDGADARCLIVDGEPPGFCAGGDITEYDWLADHPVEAGEYLDLYVRAMRRLRLLPMPTVACVDGPAIGAGLALATGCDVRLASPRARFGVTAVKRGLVYPIEELARLASLAGGGVAREVVLRGRVLDAQSALGCGLVGEVADAASIRARAIEVAAGLARAAGPVYTATKRLLARIDAGMPDECDDTRALALAAFGMDAFRAGTRDFFDGSHSR